MRRRDNWKRWEKGERKKSGCAMRRKIRKKIGLLDPPTNGSPGTTLYCPDLPAQTCHFDLTENLNECEKKNLNVQNRIEI